jgi:hypothetical protein
MGIFNEIILPLFEVFLVVVITVGLPIAFKYIKEAVNKLIKDKKVNTENMLVQHALNEVNDAVVKAVDFVNQKYVHKLKAEDKFVTELQHEALRAAIKAARDLIPNMDKTVLKEQGINIDKMLEIQVEAHINQLAVEAFERDL